MHAQSPFRGRGSGSLCFGEGPRWRPSGLMVTLESPPSACGAPWQCAPKAASSPLGRRHTK